MATIYLDPRFFTPDFVTELQERVQEEMLAGVQLTEVISQGTQFQGVPAGTTEELLQAIDYYWNEVEQTLITETQPNFGVYPTIVYGQNN